jgi:hypothetical protein
MSVNLPHNSQIRLDNVGQEDKNEGDPIDLLKMAALELLSESQIFQAPLYLYNRALSHMHSF